MSRLSLLVCALAVALAPVTAMAAGDLAKGKETFKTFCVTCHGESGKGDGPGAQGLTPSPRDFTKGEFKFDANKNGKTGEDADLKLVISKGPGEFGGAPFMPAWGGTLSDADIDNVIAVIRSLKKK
jgi:mono/diheme cytochrome c family protein